MLKDVTFGQYYPSASPVHRLDPRIKIVLVIAYIVGIFLCDSFLGYALTALLVFSVIATSRVPIGSALKSVRAITFLIVVTAVLNLFFYAGEAENWTASWWIFTVKDTALIFACKMALRLFFLVLGTSLLTLTTTPIELTDGIESLLSPLKAVRFPVHDVAMIMSIALRFIPTLMDETDKIMMAQKSRGADFESGKLLSRAKALVPILIPLIVSAFRRADELAYAMDSRCYNATKKRTRRKELRVKWRDVFATIVISAYITLIVLLNGVLFII